MRVYIPSELATHNTRGDCWVAFLGKVVDVSPVINSLPAEQAALGDPLLDNAGKDISHWFDAGTGDVRTRIDARTSQPVPFIPMGRFPGLPSEDGSTDDAAAWWRDEALVRGRLTSKVRKAWVVNTLTEQRHLLSFGTEETMEEIRERFLEMNAHCKSYTWRVLVSGEDGAAAFKPLDMSLTLDSNGVPDNEDEVEELGLPAEEYYPVMHLAFNDDLTEG